MLRLQKCILPQLLPSTSASISPLHRLISAAAPAASPGPSFAVEDYLVSTCGLTRAQALKASTKLSHLKSPANPDAVLSFLAGLGLSTADVAALVAKDPKFLCAGVEKTLAPVVVGLTGLGLSCPEIVRLVSLAGEFFRGRSVASRLAYFLFLFGSYENLLRVLSFNSSLLRCSLNKVIKANVAFLRECGLDDCGITNLCCNNKRLLSTNPEHLRAMAVRAEGLGVPRNSGMFKQALDVVLSLSQETIAAKVEYLKNSFRWSDAEVGIVVRSHPMVLVRSKETLQRKSEFLISEVGLVPACIAHRPVMLGLSLEGRLRPRHYVMRFLKENGLLDRDRSYFSAVMVTEKVFMEKYICPHKEAAPHLAEDYADACRGQAPTRFRFA